MIAIDPLSAPHSCRGAHRECPYAEYQSPPLTITFYQSRWANFRATLKGCNGIYFRGRDSASPATRDWALCQTKGHTNKRGRSYFRRSGYGRNRGSSRTGRAARRCVTTTTNCYFQSSFGRYSTAASDNRYLPSSRFPILARYSSSSRRMFFALARRSTFGDGYEDVAFAALFHWHVPFEKIICRIKADPRPVIGLLPTA